MVAQIAEQKSWMNVLTNGARNIACSVETNGVIASAIPRIIVSSAHVTPAVIPKNIDVVLRFIIFL